MYLSIKGKQLSCGSVEAEVAAVTVEDEGTPVEQEQQPQEGEEEGEGEEGGDDGGQEAEQPVKQEEEGVEETGAAGIL